VLWFLRSMKTVARVLIVYDALMVFSIVLLQWHYVVDLFGGVAVAVIAIKVHNSYLKRSTVRTVELQLEGELAHRRN